jgi:hypothetical protein
MLLPIKATFDPRPFLDYLHVQPETGVLAVTQDRQNKTAGDSRRVVSGTAGQVLCRVGWTARVAPAGFVIIVAVRAEIKGAGIPARPRRAVPE